MIPAGEWVKLSGAKGALTTQPRCAQGSPTGAGLANYPIDQASNVAVAAQSDSHNSLFIKEKRPTRSSREPMYT